MAKYAERVIHMEQSAKATRHLFESMADPSITAFSGGAPAREALPVELIHTIAAEVLTREGRGVEALQYGKPKGVYDLRAAIAEKLLRPKGISMDPEDIIVTGGGMEGVNMVSQALLDKGDVVLVESPTFVQSIQAFEMMCARCVACETDNDGYIIEGLEANIKKYRPKIIYVIPTFQNPTGRTTTPERRKQIVDLANRYDITVVEDDPYGDMRYSGAPIPPLMTFDKNENVIYANSLSKIFSPGSRLGYVCGPSEFMRRLYDVKTATNSHTGMLSQIMCAEFFNRGYFEPHLLKLRDIHRERRDVMMECVKSMMPDGASYVYPDGGLFTWVELPERINTTDMLEDAMAQKVAYMPGEKFFTHGQPIRTNCMRLSFGGVVPEQIRAGMERLSAVIKSKL